MKKPTIGCIVHYVLDDGQHRAATVVNAWPGAPEGICNLTVHLDGCNDLNVTLDHALQLTRVNCLQGKVPMGAFDMGNGTLSVGSAHQDESAKLPGTWHWPEREEWSPATAQNVVKAADLNAPAKSEGTHLTAGVTPTVGRDVHYVSYGTPKGEYTPAHRAAKITDVRESDQFGFEVRVCVMNPEGLFFTGWTHFDPAGAEGGTVHWPERA